MKIKVVSAPNIRSFEEKVQAVLDEYTYKVDKDPETGHIVSYAFRSMTTNAIIDNDRKPLVIATILYDEIDLGG